MRQGMLLPNYHMFNRENYHFFEFYGFRIFAGSQLKKRMTHHTFLFGSWLTACITEMCANLKPNGWIQTLFLWILKK